MKLTWIFLFHSSYKFLPYVYIDMLHKFHEKIPYSLFTNKGTNFRGSLPWYATIEATDLSMDITCFQNVFINIDFWIVLFLKFNLTYSTQPIIISQQIVGWGDKDFTKQKGHSKEQVIINYGIKTGVTIMIFILIYNNMCTLYLQTMYLISLCSFIQLFFASSRKLIQDLPLFLQACDTTLYVTRPGMFLSNQNVPKLTQLITFWPAHFHFIQ